MRWVVTIAASLLVLVVGLFVAFVLAYTGFTVPDFDRPFPDAPLPIARAKALNDLGPAWPGSITSIDVTDASLVARRIWLGLDERSVTFPCRAGRCDVPLNGDAASGPADHLQFILVLAFPALVVAGAFRYSHARAIESTYPRQARRIGRTDMAPGQDRGAP